MEDLFNIEETEFERDMETFVDMYEAAQNTKESVQPIPQHEYVLIDDGRWEDVEWVNEQAELSACEDLIGKVSE